MRNSVWIVLTVGVAFVGSLLGYSVSSHTGVEPGFFELPEAGGYGASAGGGSGASEGVSSDMEEYYKKLLE